ncbi:MAG TPA: hypothetical protein VK116_09440, partial [Planctomycetota bacterium]|nr:hypothetical protein [Planctomycetota bacterium]
GVGAHLGTAPVVFWNGVPGATFESLPDGECAIFDPFLGSRRCFRLTLPRGPVAGVVFFEVGGVRTRGIFVVARAPLDDAAPTVVAASIADGSAAAADAQIVLRFSELLDGESRASVLVNGVPIEGERQELRHFSSGATELLIAPPVGGWPAGELSVIAGAEIVDLAGHRLDQDPGTAAAEDFELTLTIGG